MTSKSEVNVSEYLDDIEKKIIIQDRILAEQEENFFDFKVPGVESEEKSLYQESNNEKIESMFESSNERFHPPIEEFRDLEDSIKLNKPKKIPKPVPIEESLWVIPKIRQMTKAYGGKE